MLHVHFSVCVKAEEKGWKPLSYSIPDAFLKAFLHNSTLHEDSTTNLEKKRMTIIFTDIYLVSSISLGTFHM